MIETLNERLSKIVQSVKGRAIITEDDLDVTMREIRIALLEADVALIVVKDFINEVKKKCTWSRSIKIYST